MGKFRMLMPERIGLIIVAILLLVFAIVMLTRSCVSSTNEPPITPNQALVDSLSKAPIDTLKSDTVPSPKTKKKKKSPKSQKPPIKPHQRNHLNEPAE